MKASDLSAQGYSLFDRMVEFYRTHPLGGQQEAKLLEAAQLAEDLSGDVYTTEFAQSAATAWLNVAAMATEHAIRCEQEARVRQRDGVAIKRRQVALMAAIVASGVRQNGSFTTETLIDDALFQHDIEGYSLKLTRDELSQTLSLMETAQKLRYDGDTETYTLIQ